MRILVESNVYPPHYIGGYELGCYDVVAGLRARGHEVRVLTSTYGVDHPTTNDQVYRWLQISFDSDPTWDDVVVKEATNQRALQLILSDFCPNIFFCWNLRHASISHAALAQRAGIATCYYVFDNWLADWKTDHWYRAFLNRGDSRLFRLLNLIPPPETLDLTNVIFASNYLKAFTEKRENSLHEAPVIHFGIDCDRFGCNSAGRAAPRKLLYVGQIVPHKGVHTALKAFGLLKRNYPDNSLALTIVGDAAYSPDYVAYLKNLAQRTGIQDTVHFVGTVPRWELPNIYNAHDILLFPSVWDEPFGITPLEAMSCGLVIVTTASGGSSEFLEPDINALTFPKEDYVSCARQVGRLVQDPQLFKRLRANARQCVETKFRLDKAIDAIEELIIQAGKRPSPGQVKESESRNRLSSWSLDTKLLERTRRRARRWLRIKDLYNRAEKRVIAKLQDGRRC